MNTTLKQILRWLAVVPGALLGAIIVMFPVHWVAMYLHHFGTPDPMITDEQGRGLLQSMPLESLERFGDALFIAGTFIAVGAFIAPRFHFATAIVLTVLLVGLMSWAFFSLNSMGMHLDDTPFRMVINAILWLVSVASALSYARGLDKGT
jgi:hypothetical protein